MYKGVDNKRCVICSQVYKIEKFRSLVTNEVTRVCVHCQRLSWEGQKERIKSLYAHLWIRSDGTEITDPREVVNDGQKHKCRICKELKEVKEFSLSGGKYNPRLTKACTQCLKIKTIKREKKEEECIWCDSYCSGY